MTAVLVLGAMAGAICDNLQSGCREGVRFVAAADPQAAERSAPDADVIFCMSPELTDGILQQAPNLRWIQAMTAGTDHIESLSSLRKDVILTSARGMHGPQVSEMALLHMLAVSRNIPRFIDNQRDSRWDRWEQPLLWGKTVVIVGLGVIANALAARCKALEMTVIGVTETVRNLAHFDSVVARSDLTSIASSADFLVVLAPYNKRNHHLIDAAVLKAMKSSAILVNLARGGVVDEDALLATLTARSIAGAGLDVFKTEPLPVGHPFWQLGNVLITPHVAGMSDCYVQQLLPLLRRNLDAYLDGNVGRLENTVAA